MISRAQRIFNKAEQAFLFSIEAYNKPDSPYREETFAILAVNAWELLLKAKLVKESGSKLSSLYVYENRTLKTGAKSNKRYVKRSRSGNAQTIGIKQTLSKLRNEHSIKVDSAVITNLDALIEIRDCAIHLLNYGPGLSEKVLGVGTASVKNFIQLSRLWFSYDLSKYNLYLMPIGFVTAPSKAAAIHAIGDEKRLVEYLVKNINKPNSSNDFHVSLEVNLSLKRSSVDAEAQVRVTNDPAAPAVQLSEEDIRQQYPWDYAKLTKKLSQRYLDFKANKKYHDVRKPLKLIKKYTNVRYLEPGNPNSAKKDYYNPNIVDEFDRHYTRR